MPSLPGLHRLVGFDPALPCRAPIMPSLRDCFALAQAVELAAMNVGIWVFGGTLDANLVHTEVKAREFFLIFWAD